MVHIRNIRKEKSMTLKQLADKTGCTIGYLSQIERGMKEPSLEVLRKIAFALELDITDLLSERGKSGQRGYEIVHKTEREKLFIEELELTYEMLTRTDVVVGQRNGIKAMTCILKPKTAGTGEAVSHNTAEFVYVLQGSMLCRLEEEQFRLDAGDSLLIPPGALHAFRNVSEEDTEILMVTC